MVTTLSVKTNEVLKTFWMVKKDFNNLVKALGVLGTLTNKRISPRNVDTHSEKNVMGKSLLHLRLLGENFPREKAQGQKDREEGKEHMRSKKKRSKRIAKKFFWL